MRPNWVRLEAAALSILLHLPLVAVGQEVQPAHASGADSLTNAKKPEPAASSNAAVGAKVTLSYYELMSMPLPKRYELLDNYPADERGAFLDSLSGPRRAALMVDPNDCGPVARFKRTTVANNKQDPGALANATQDVAQSVTVAMANRFFSGLGGALTAAARVNEGRKLLEYKDICDADKEERAALLSPKPDSAESPPEPTETKESFLDKASKFFSR